MSYQLCMASFELRLCLLIGSTTTDNYTYCVCGAGAQKCAISRTWVVETQPFYYFMDERSLGAVSRQKSIAALMLCLRNIVWCGHISEQRDASSVGRDALVGPLFIAYIGNRKWTHYYDGVIIITLYRGVKCVVFVSGSDMSIDKAFSWQQIKTCLFCYI